MRGGLTATPHLAPDPLQAAVDRRLDARLDLASPAPVALGLSGGGDSLTLLHLAAAWCARVGRPLLALTVDHALSPESAGWTARAERMAADAGVSWRALAWTGPKPTTGLPAAARTARHALLADAARKAGAGVLLLAHTADDHAETEALRLADARGIGRLREWAPSPAWPEGRGMMLLRPLLDVARAELRAWLRARRLDWLEDPANLDGRFARARLRAQGVAASLPAADEPAGFGEGLADGRVLLPWRPLLDREAGALRSLAAALACAAGGLGPPRGRQVATLMDRLGSGEPPAGPGAETPARTTISTLNGARVEVEGATVVVGRNLGRRPPADAALTPGEAAVWDGRFEASAQESGWRIGAAAGRLSRLPAAERDLLRALPPALRSAHPVFVRGEEVRLRTEGLELRGLVPARFDAAVGRIASEAALGAQPR